MESPYALISTSISSMYHDIQKIERTEMAKHGLKGPHAQCLLAIQNHPEGITSAGLVEVCDKDKAAISRTLAELEEAGMVLRETRNGSRYRASLKLTEQGKTVAESVQQVAGLAVELAGAGLDDGDREVFYRVLASISGHLQELCRNGLTKPRT